MSELREVPLEYIDDPKKGIRYTVPKEGITIDGKLDFTDADDDGNVVITITPEEG